MVTGGAGPDSAIATVQVYTLAGPQEQLPDLQTPRSGHACAHYMDNQDRAVSIACNITVHLTLTTLHFVVILIIIVIITCRYT